MKTTALAFLILALAACSQNPIIETNINRLAVQAILNPDLENQIISVSDAINIAQSDGITQPELDNPTSGAIVIVRSSTQEVRFSEISPGVYKDLAEKLHVAPLKTYTLEVRDPEGRIVTGRTTVPERPHFLTPQNESSFNELVDVNFEWQPSERIGFYLFGEVVPKCSRFNPEFSAFNQLRFLHETKTVIRFRQWLDCGFVDREVMNLRVFAVDSAAAAFVWPSLSGFGRGGQKASNIENGVGVFGSMVADSVKILIKKPVGE